MILMIPQVVEETDRPQRSIWQQSTKLGVQPPHNPCFCPESGWLDNSPSTYGKISEANDNAMNYPGLTETKANVSII